MRPNNALITPRKIAKRREHLIQVPVDWLERLNGARHMAYRMALHLLYRDWRINGESIMFANGALALEGMSRGTKWRALGELTTGADHIERRPKAPRIQVLSCATSGSGWWADPGPMIFVIMSRIWRIRY